MAPEQLEGKEADHRTDIFAFGAVVYEMATGQRAFSGESQASLIGAILKDEPPPMSTLQTMTPPALDYVVKTCLAKDPDDRWQSAGDVGRQVTGIIEGRSRPGFAGPVVTEPERTRWRHALPWVAAIALAVVTGLTAWTLGSAAPPLAIDHVSVQLRADISLGGRRFAALSPDGRQLVYVGEREGTTQLYHRPMNEVDAVPIPNTEGATNPFFSPDGEWVGFQVGETFKKVQLSGRRLETVSETLGASDGGSNTYAAWSSDDTIWFGGGDTGLYQVAATGGVPRLMTTPPGDRGHMHPQPLPGGRGILYTDVRGVATSNAVAVYSLDDDEHRVLTDDGHTPFFLSTGHVVFSRGADLYALPFDIDRLEPLGDPVLVLEGVRGIGRGGGGARGLQWFVGGDGTLVYVPSSGSSDDLRMVWVNQQGDEEPIDAQPGYYQDPRVSPDGSRVLLQKGETNADIWMYDVERRTFEPLTSDPGHDRLPVWTRDGTGVYFASNRDRDDKGEFDIFSRAASIAGSYTPFYADPDRSLSPFSFSRDGRTLLVTGLHLTDEIGFDIGSVPVEGERRWTTLRRPYNEFYPDVSPGGQWLAYISNDSGQRGVYLEPFPNVDGRRWRIEPGLLNDFVWSRDGTQLFYRERRDQGAVFLDQGEVFMMAVSIDPDPASLLPVGAPRELFEDTHFIQDIGRHFDIAPDGRFLMLTDGIDSAAPRYISVVRNWGEALKERVPVN